MSPTDLRRLASGGPLRLWLRSNPCFDDDGVVSIRAYRNNFVVLATTMQTLNYDLKRGLVA